MKGPRMTFRCGLELWPALSPNDRRGFLPTGTNGLLMEGKKLSGRDRYSKPRLDIVNRHLSATLDRKFRCTLSNTSLYRLTSSKSSVPRTFCFHCSSCYMDYDSNVLRRGPFPTRSCSIIQMLLLPSRHHNHLLNLCSKASCSPVLLSQSQDKSSTY